MWFRARSATALEGALDAGAAALTVNIGGANQLQVTLRLPTPDESAQATNIWCEAVGQWEVGAGLRRVLEDVEQGRLPKPLKPAQFTQPTSGIELDGVVVPIDALPESYDDVVDAISRSLHSAAGAALRLVRWRYAMAGVHRALVSSKGLELSEDRTNWRPAPTAIYGVVTSRGYPRLDSAKVAVIQKMIDEERAEPLAHELLREAQDIWQSAPRSCYVIAVAALEVGIKEFLASRVPEAEWLVWNVPSPPIFKLLRDYLPTLLSTALPPPPRRLMRLADDAVPRRNTTVHSKGDVPTGRELRDLLDGVSDLLHLFDVYRGEGWALDNLTFTTEQELGLRDAQGEALPRKTVV